MKYWQLILGLVLGVALGYFSFYHKATNNIISNLVTERRGGGGKLTNPLLECVSPEDGGPMSQLSIDKLDLDKFVKSIISKGKVDFISVYVRDLNNGPWIGINEKEEFIGASLLKVPVLIAYMKLADDDPSILKKEIEYKVKDIANTDYFPPSHEIEVGKKYTVEQLLEYMIKYSDNNAANLLFQNIKKGDIDNVFDAIGTGSPDFNQPYPVNTKTYAGFFRILFNSSYLTKASSEKALNLLTQTEFKRGLVAQIPDNIVVAHKFGIRGEAGVNQLHDCGIVYYPKHPYLMCIMSRGGEFDDLAQAISDVSNFVYGEVAKTQ